MSQLPLPHSRDFSSTKDVLWLLRGLATCRYSQFLSSSLPPRQQMNGEKNGFLFFLSVHLYLRIIQSFLCSFALIYSSSSPRVAIKERKVTGFVTSEFSWNAQWASNTGRILQHGVPGDHLKPMAFIRKSQALSGWCKVLPGALTWWRPEEDGGEPDFARINAPNDGALGIYYSVVPGWKVQLKGEINVL